MNFFSNCKNTNQSMKFIEKVDLQRLYEVCNENLLNYPSKNPNDSSEWYKMTKTDLQNYKNKIKKNVVEVEYKRKKEDIGGRLYSSGCIQHMIKPIRNYLLNGTLTDIDIVNCHPTIIKYLFDTYNIQDIFLNEYINDREETMKKYNILNKEEILCIINSENINIKQNDLLKIFHSNIYGDNGLLNKMEKKFKENKNDLIKKIYKYVNSKKKENIKGSVFSHILGYYEDIILDKIIKFMNNNDIEISVLMFDGLMVYNNEKLNEEFLRKLEKFIFDKTNINVKLVYKSTDTDWRPIIGDVEEEKEEEDIIEKGEKFSIEKSRDLLSEHWVVDKKGKVIGLDLSLNSNFIKYMNNYVCKFYEPVCFGFRQFPYEHFKLYKEKQLEICLSSHSLEQNSQNTLFASTKSSYLKSFDKMDFIVDYKNGDKKICESGYEVYNLYNRQPSSYVEDIEDKCKLFFTYLYEIISDSNQEFYEYLLNWLSIKFQYGKVGMAIVLMSYDFGTGKGTFAECIEYLVGDRYTFTDTCGQRIGRQFNSLESNKLVGFYEEMANNSGENIIKSEIMKQKITDKKDWVEFKGVEPYMTTNLCDYIFITNGQNPVKIIVGDRRYVANKLSNKMLGNKEYFVNVKNNVKDNVEGLRYFFENRKVNIFEMKPIMTEAYKRIIELNEDIRQSFINDRLEDIMEGYNYNISCKELFDKFCEYCYENNYNGTRNFKYFIDYVISRTNYKKEKDVHKKTFIVKK